ncbi:SHOCT domain-containing protein [Streptomyces sp. NRRL S-244]|uniref:SHOCT domain-containing protein n=1 Tax=Streptomyces sp. NRRL S-244 TaxID=1463897 RepID=UPI0004C256CB|nr:SHOCT domain-containing protein [Streptomyces sp. NRRL S-244]
MFIRPVGTRVDPARRPTGRPLLQGLLARAAGRPPAAEPSGSETAGAEASGSAGPGAEPTDSQPVAPAGPETAPAKSAAPDGRMTTDGGQTTPPPAGLATELAQLATLAREGLLTPQEFKEAKTRLLHS